MPFFADFDTVYNRARNIARIRLLRGLSPGRVLQNTRSLGSLMVRGGQAAVRLAPALESVGGLTTAAGARALAGRAVALARNPWTLAAAGTLAVGAGLATMAEKSQPRPGSRRPSLDPYGTGRSSPPSQLADKTGRPYGAPESTINGRNMNPALLSSNDWAQYGLTPPGPAPAPGPGGSQVPMVSPATRAERERRAQMLGNAGVQAPLPPLEDLKPYWDRPENQAIRTAATPGKDGFVAPGGQAHSDRADMMAWLEANKNAQAGVDGRNIVDRYLLKEYNRGALGEKGLAMARARGLVKDAPADYSGAFSRDQGFSPADAYGSKFDLPEFASVGSEDIKQWPQTAIAPEQIAERYQGGMDLDPRSVPNAVPAAPFAAPLKADYQQLFSPGNQQLAPMVSTPASIQQAAPRWHEPSAPADAAVLAGYGGSPMEFPTGSSTTNAFNTGLDLGVSYSDPNGNRDQAFANSFLEERKRAINRALFAGYQR